MQLTHGDLIGHALDKLERDCNIIEEKCQIKGYNPDIYCCIRSNGGALIREIIIEAEVTLNDLWRLHTIGQLKIACDYCRKSASKRKVILVVPRSIDRDARRMIALRRMKEIEVWSF